jgi:hypothetical protein
MSVLLKGRNGNEVEIAFVREALPEMQDGHGDSAWFTVVIRAATADESWEESSPCLGSMEFRNLADWLESVGRSDEAGGEAEGSASEIELLEPELKFSLARQDDKGVDIRIGFHLPDRPERFSVDDATEAESIDVYMERESVRGAAEALRAALDEFDEWPRDDVRGETDPGVSGAPDPDLNMVDRVEKDPPGAGFGEDNAGKR